MNNLLTVLRQTLNQQFIAVARIERDKGNGLWLAVTQTGVKVILKGEAQVGATVFYDVPTAKILSRAPRLAVIEMPLD